MHPLSDRSLRSTLHLATLLATLALTALPALAQTDDATPADADQPADPPGPFAEVRSDLWLDDGAMKGPGAETLRAAASDARYVFVGEDHGVAEIAHFSAAFFAELAGEDTTLGLEIGPAAAEGLTAALAAPNPKAAAAAFVQRYPFSVAFYDMAEEIDFVLRVREAAGGSMDLVGFDQELMGAGRLVLDRIAARVGDAPEVRAAIDALRAEADAAYERASASGNPGELFLMTAADDAFDDLAARLASLDDPAPARWLDELLESRGIYQQAMGGQGYVSNLRRARLMKRHLAGHLDRLHAHEDAGAGRVLIKVGAFHAYKGINPIGSREIGNFLAERAEGEGTSSLHVLVIASSGTQLAFGGVGKPGRVAEIGSVEGGPIAALAPLYAEAAGAAGASSTPWSLFDLRPLRSKYLATSKTDREEGRIVHGFDFVVVIPEGTASRGL